MQLWTDCIFAPASARAGGTPPHRIGLLPGQGIGPEVTRVALRAIEALGEYAPLDARLAEGPWEPTPRDPVSPGIAAFCAETFAAGGAVLAGPYGGRFVYDLRRRFDLFCKLNPLVPSRALRGAGRLRPQALEGVDVLVVRENLGGVYQGEWRETRSPTGERVAEHAFRYTEGQVRRVLGAAARLAAGRRGSMTVVVKPGGTPSISRLWCDGAEEAAAAEGVSWRSLEGDCAAYRLIQHPGDFDVVVAPNLFADVLCDLGAVLLGSRGLSFGGSYAEDGAAVYQTNHGAALDLAGTGRCNPCGHLLALAMLLRQSHGLLAAADAIETAIDATWAEGLRTEDLAEPGTRVVGTAEIGDRIVAAVRRQAERRATLDALR